MSTSRFKEISRMARRATPAKLHDLYYEVFGADFAGSVTPDRARQSIQEACHELLERKGKALPESDPLPSLDVKPPEDERAAAAQAAPPPDAPRRFRLKHRVLEPL